MILADAGFFYALADADDAWHARAVQALHTQEEGWITTWPVLTEADWILNESHELEHLDWLQSRVGPRTLIVQNLCGWKGHDASMWRKLDRTKFGFYGYARADAKTTMVDMRLEHNVRNIEILRQAYHEM